MTLPLDTLTPPQVCRMLRTKTAFGAYSLDSDPLSWQDGESTTAVFWCLRTMETAGPDEDFAHPSTCRAGRECFQSPRGS
jgi:hypothetical protein